eukprot:8836748-Lingulodinium_polyedra.AAC.1
MACWGSATVAAECHVHMAAGTPAETARTARPLARRSYWTRRPRRPLACPISLAIEASAR